MGFFSRSWPSLPMEEFLILKCELHIFVRTTPFLRFEKFVEIKWQSNIEAETKTKHNSHQHLRQNEKWHIFGFWKMIGLYCTDWLPPWKCKTLSHIHTHTRPIELPVAWFSHHSKQCVSIYIPSHTFRVYSMPIYAHFVQISLSLSLSLSLYIELCMYHVYHFTD